MYNLSDYKMPSALGFDPNRDAITFLHCSPINNKKKNNNNLFSNLIIFGSYIDILVFLAFVMLLYTSSKMLKKEEQISPNS